MACRLRSATEHHTLQHAGPVAWKEKRQQDGGDEEALCPWPAVRDTKALWEQHKTYCYSDRKSRFFFFETLHPCVPAWGVHTVLWEGFELTQVTVAPSPVWRRWGDELFKQPVPLSSDVLLCLMGRWGEPATTSSTSSQGGRHMTAAGWNIQGTSIFPGTGHHFREQRQNNSALSKWQPSLQHTITDCWSITPHTRDEMTATPCW